MQLLQLFLPLSALHHAQITREAGPVKGGSSVIAFAKDPTGYMWELIQRPAGKEPLCQACTACLCVFWGGAWLGGVLFASYLLVICMPRLPACSRLLLLLLLSSADCLL